MPLTIEVHQNYNKIKIFQHCSVNKFRLITHCQKTTHPRYSCPFPLLSLTGSATQYNCTTQQVNTPLATYRRTTMYAPSPANPRLTTVYQQDQKISAANQNVHTVNRQYNINRWSSNFLISSLLSYSFLILYRSFWCYPNVSLIFHYFKISFQTILIFISKFSTPEIICLLLNLFTFQYISIHSYLSSESYYF